jgi:hypothetical protein
MVQTFRESYFTDLGFSMGHEGQTFMYLWKGYGFGVTYSLDDNAVNAVRILTLMSVQGLLVFGLHCAELFVNMARDEATWRKATSKHGAQHNYNSIKVAIKSPQTISLFAIKATAHWAMGESFAVSNFGVTREDSTHLPADYCHGLPRLLWYSPGY